MGSFVGRGNNYQIFHLRSSQDTNNDIRGGRRECYQSATTLISREYFPNANFFVRFEKDFELSVEHGSFRP